MAPNTPDFQYEVETLQDDGQGNKVTTVRCHGVLAIANAGLMKEVVKPLIPQGGRIVIDLGDLKYMDSTGLGVLVSLKAAALRQGLCILQFENMTPRVLELLRVTNLMQLFSS
jgi:anti-anti-sigma factor